jgi:hypothetical protein
MHEELKSKSTGGGVDERLKDEFERLQRENNQLHQEMITTKEDCSRKLSQLALQLKQLSAVNSENQLREG